ncbi:MAG: hypothetical protein J7521_00190 [Caulobacter sp.]|nr:hypothetical protein [Caulobacter sp.]
MKQPPIHRIVITVCRNDGLWAVEEAGLFFGASPDKDIAKASAARRARERIGEGQACQIRVAGENGFVI